MNALPRLPIGQWALLAFVSATSVYPIVRLLLVPLLPGLAPGQIVPRGDGQHLLSVLAIENSCRIGVEAGVCALIPGVALAFILERLDWRGARVLDASLWLLLLTPSYLLSTGWQLLVSAQPFVSGPLHQLLFSEFGIVAMLALKGLPFACLSARMGWSAIGGEITAALQIHVGSRLRRAMIIAGLLAPTAGSVFAVVFIEAITDFGIAATLGAHLHMPLVIYSVYAALARTPVDFAQAARLSLVLIVLASAAVLLHHVLRRRSSGVANASSRAATRLVPGTADRALASTAVGGLILAAFVVPGTALFVRAIGINEPSRLGAQDLYSLRYSLAYAFVGATLAVLLTAMLLARRGQRSLLGSQVFDIATLGAMAIPSIVLGAAYVIAFNGWLPLYGTPILLLMGFLATHLPTLSRFLVGPLGSIHSSLTDAARLHGLRLYERIELVHLPLLMRPLLWGWSIAFASIFFELPLSSLLYPVGRQPVGVTILALDETLRFADEARLALLGMAVCLGVIGFVTVLLPRWLIGRPLPSMPVIA